MASLSGTLSVVKENSSDTRKRDYRVISEWACADWSKRLDQCIRQPGGTSFEFDLAKAVPFDAFERAANKPDKKRIDNGADLKDKFFLVERGPKGGRFWPFAEIAKEAKAAGAAGVIIVNYDDSVVEMQAEKTFVDIPVLMVSRNEMLQLNKFVQADDFDGGNLSSPLKLIFEGQRLGHSTKCCPAELLLAQARRMASSSTCTN